MCLGVAVLNFSIKTSLNFLGNEDPVLFCMKFGSFLLFYGQKLCPC